MITPPPMVETLVAIANSFSSISLARRSNFLYVFSRENISDYGFSLRSTQKQRVIGFKKDLE